MRRTLRGVGRLFDPKRGPYPATVGSWERLPDTRAMLVANHSGGTVIPDAWGLLAAWYRHHDHRPLHVLGHDMLFATERTARFLARRGVLRARRDLARRVLADHRKDLLVFPGGDRDTWRPFSARWKIDFHGRRGYARMALETGTPIVPVAHAGAHHTLIVLDDGNRIARRLGLPKHFRAHIFPVHLSFPFGLTVGPWPHLPPPTAMRYQLGHAVHPDVVGPDGPTHAQVEALDIEVQAELQRQLDVLRETSRAFLDRVAETAQRVRGTVVRLTGRDLHADEQERLARELRGRPVVAVAAK